MHKDKDPHIGLGLYIKPILHGDVPHEPVVPSIIASEFISAFVNGPHYHMQGIRDDIFSK